VRAKISCYRAAGEQDLSADAPSLHPHQSALPEDLRTPLFLAEYEERSHAEIGGILGCTVKAVESRIYRARQQLRASLGSVLETV